MSSHSAFAVSGVQSFKRLPVSLVPKSHRPLRDQQVTGEKANLPLRVFQPLTTEHEVFSLLTTGYLDMLRLPKVEYSSSLVGESDSIREIREIIPVVAQSDVNVLITGETGTGKELVARDIHASSPRKNGPFIAVNCAAIPKDTVESALFGHEHGAFTDALKRKAGLFESANGGTLFLDEVGELSICTQAKLNRAIEYRTFQRVGGTDEIKVDVREILATNCDIDEALRSGKISRGFYDRIAVIRIHMPPLRERKEDIPLLANHLLQKYVDLAPDKEVYGFTEGAMEKLQQYNWPGNIRELENVIRRALIVTNGMVIDKEDILITQAETSVKILEHIDDLAKSEVPVLISGETGTGKELVAREIHARSKHSDGPFVVVNCAALDPSLAESELFGHVKGAFTGAHHTRKGLFELADGSTLFLDEVGELDYDVQTKLLRALQEGEITVMGTSDPKKVTVRIIAATNIDLEQAVKERKFREDLYHRLSVVPVELPPLRERKEEIPELARGFLAELRNGKNIPGISDDAMAKLMAYEWPGNIRELRTVIRRAIILTQEGCPIEQDKIVIYSSSIKPNGNGHLKDEMEVPGTEKITHPVLVRYLRELNEYTTSGGSVDDDKVRLLFYKSRIVLLLLNFNGRRLSLVKVARELGIDKRTLHKLVIKFGYSSAEEMVARLRVEVKGLV